MNISEISEVDQAGFDEMMGVADNSVDTFIGLDETILRDISKFALVKKKAELRIKVARDLEESIRAMMTSYMGRVGSDKLEGVTFKSISFISGVSKTRSLSDRQVMVSGKYQSLSELSKDDLVSLLVKKGVKTRVVGSDQKYKTEDSIRVYR